MATFTNHVPPPELIRLVRNQWTDPFWQATSEHRLVIPRCGECGTYRLPPTPFCFVCRSQVLEWAPHDGRGIIYSFTVVRHPVIPEVAEGLPYIAVVVQLEGLPDGIRLIGSLVDASPDDARIGRSVVIDWYDVDDETTVPVFRLSS